MDTSSTKIHCRWEWKDATVLAGPIVEALLLWALHEYILKEYQNCLNAFVTNKTFKKEPENQIDRWTLDTYMRSH